MSKEVSPFDGLFWAMVLFAIVIDALDFVFEIGIVANLFLAAPIIWYMTSHGVQAPGAADVQAHQMQRQAAKRAARRALRRGLLIFVAELIPLLNLLPFWLIAVLAMLRQQNVQQPTQDMREAV